MRQIYFWILTLAIISGQLIKLPILSSGGITLVDITVILFCIFGFFKLNFKFKKPLKFLQFGFLFIAIAILSLVLTPLHLNINQYFVSFLYTLRFSVYILLIWEIYCGAFNSLKKDGSDILLISGIILAILGLLQLILIPDLRFLSNWGWDPHYFRTVSTFLDPNFLGGFFVLTLLLLFQKKLPNKIKIPLFILIYVALMTTFSRGTYLAFFVSFTIFSYLNKSIKLFLLTVILSLGLLFGYYHYQKSVAEPRHIDRAQSAEYRLNAWEQGLTLFEKYPILGVGYNAYRFGLEQNNLGNSQFLNSHGASTNDSSLLFVASTTGLLGLISYLIFLIVLIRTTFGTKTSSGYILISGIGGLIIQSFFANTLFYPFILIWLCLQIAGITY